MALDPKVAEAIEAIDQEIATHRQIAATHYAQQPATIKDLVKAKQNDAIANGLERALAILKVRCS